MTETLVLEIKQCYNFTKWSKITRIYFKIYLYCYPIVACKVRYRAKIPIFRKADFSVHICMFLIDSIAFFHNHDKRQWKCIQIWIQFYYTTWKKHLQWPLCFITKIVKLSSMFHFELSNNYLIILPWRPIFPNSLSTLKQVYILKKSLPQVWTMWVNNVNDKGTGWVFENLSWSMSLVIWVKFCKIEKTSLSPVL